MGTNIANIRRTAMFSVLALCSMGGVPASATPLLTNLIVNGDAEAGTGAADFASTVVPTGWTTTSNFTAVQYAAGGGGDLNTADSTAVGGGLDYFAGGVSNSLATASQVLNISDLAASVDAGGLTAAFSALIGGFATQGDNMTVQSIFRDSLNNALLTLTLGPVTPADRGDVSQLLSRSANAIVPIGTRSVEVLMTSTRLDGSYNDGYADNLSFVLGGGPATGVPEPGALSLLGLGLAALSAARRKQ